MARILIELEGGLVEKVISDEPVEVVVIDRDDIPDDDARVYVLFDEKGEPGKAYARQFEAEEDSFLVDHYFAQMVVGDSPGEDIEF